MYVRQSRCFGPRAPRWWWFRGPHTPVVLHFDVHSVPKTCTQKINEFRVDTKHAQAPASPSIIKCDLCECPPPPVLHERTALPLITHTLLSATCGFCNLVLLCVCHATLLVTHKRVPTYLGFTETVPWSAGGSSVCSCSGVCDISSSGWENLEDNIVEFDIRTCWTKAP